MNINPNLDVTQHLFVWEIYFLIQSSKYQNFKKLGSLLGLVEKLQIEPTFPAISNLLSICLWQNLLPFISIYQFIAILQNCKKNIYQVHEKTNLILNNPGYFYKILDKISILVTFLYRVEISDFHISLSSLNTNKLKAPPFGQTSPEGQHFPVI